MSVQVELELRFTIILKACKLRCIHRTRPCAWCYSTLFTGRGHSQTVMNRSSVHYRSCSVGGPQRFLRTIFRYQQRSFQQQPAEMAELPNTNNNTHTHTTHTHTHTPHTLATYLSSNPWNHQSAIGFRSAPHQPLDDEDEIAW